jgi:hypothetical protein
MGQKLTLVIAALIAVILLLTYGAVDALLPSGVLEHRTQVVVVLSLLVVFLILLSPIAVEVDSDPRPLSGPGKSPKGPNLP